MPDPITTRGELGSHALAFEMALLASDGTTATGRAQAAGRVWSHLHALERAALAQREGTPDAGERS